MITNLKKYKFITSILLLLIIINRVFHYNIFFENALTGEHVSTFQIKISAMRILFEPVLGPLLFYSRADQPDLELKILFIWILIISFGFVLISVFRFRNQENRIHKFFRGFLNIIFIGIIGFGIYLIILFVPLPSNTIINNSVDDILINTHSHTEFSHDGIISQKGLWNWHKRNGFDAFFITDHNHHEKTLEFVKSQRDDKIPSYPLVIAGEEFSGSNHMTILGLKENFITRGLSDDEVINLTHAQDGAVLVAHWFKGDRRNNTINFYVEKGVDGFEIANQNVGLTYDRRIFNNIVNSCKENRLIINGGVDYHGYGSTCFLWNAVKIPQWHQMSTEDQQASIITILRQRQSDKLKVLLYRDRYIFDRDLVFFSPVFTIFGYFRTLNVFQIISWIMWFVLIVMIRNYYINQKFTFMPFNRLIHIASVIVSIFSITIGIKFLLKGKVLTDFNNVFIEYGNIALYFGIISFVFSLFVYMIYKKYVNNGY